MKNQIISDMLFGLNQRQETMREDIEALQDDIKAIQEKIKEIEVQVNVMSLKEFEKKHRTYQTYTCPYCGTSMKREEPCQTQ